MNQMQTGIAFGHFLLGRHAEALGWARKALNERPDYRSALRLAAASAALVGRSDEAKRFLGRLRALDPGLRLANLPERIPLRREADFARFAEGLRLAGLD